MDMMELTREENMQISFDLPDDSNKLKLFNEAEGVLMVLTSTIEILEKTSREAVGTEEGAWCSSVLNHINQVIVDNDVKVYRK